METLTNLFKRFFSTWEENNTNTSTKNDKNTIPKQTDTCKKPLKKNEIVISKDELEIIFNKMDKTDYRNGNDDKPRYLDLDRLNAYVLSEKKKNGNKTLVDIRRDPIQRLTYPPQNIYYLIFEGDLNLEKYNGLLNDEEIDIIFNGVSKSDYTSYGHSRYGDFGEVANDAVKQKETNGDKKVKSVKLTMSLESMPPINRYSIEF